MNFLTIKKGTKGGRILVGVDDNGKRVKGFDDPNKTQQTITNWIAEYYNPKIDVHIEYFEKLEILVVGIQGGKNKPYDLKGKGPFLRVGATNRITSRTERENMSKRDNTGILMTL